MIPEEVGIADVGLQDVHALVPAYVAHFEDAGATPGSAGQETRPQRVSPHHGGVEPDAVGIGLGDIADRLRG
jgi:hypothetical protein